MDNNVAQSGKTLTRITNSSWFNNVDWDGRVGHVRCRRGGGNWDRRIGRIGGRGPCRGCPGSGCRPRASAWASGGAPTPSLPLSLFFVFFLSLSFSLSIPCSLLRTMMLSSASRFLDPELSPITMNHGYGSDSNLWLIRLKYIVDEAQRNLSWAFGPIFVPNGAVH